MYHNLEIVGNLGTEPEMKYIGESGTAVTKFNLAANRQYTASDGNKVKETVWFRVTVWNKMAEACNEYLKKGSKVFVSGRLQASPEGNPKIWTTKEGSPAASFEVTASTVIFLDSRGTETRIEEEIPF